MTARTNIPTPPIAIHDSRLSHADVNRRLVADNLDLSRSNSYLSLCNVNAVNVVVFHIWRWSRQLHSHVAVTDTLLYVCVVNVCTSGKSEAVDDVTGTLVVNVVCTFVPIEDVAILPCVVVRFIVVDISIFSMGDFVAFMSETKKLIY